MYRLRPLDAGVCPWKKEEGVPVKIRDVNSRLGTGIKLEKRRFTVDERFLKLSVMIACPNDSVMLAHHFAIVIQQTGTCSPSSKRPAQDP